MGARVRVRVGARARARARTRVGLGVGVGARRASSTIIMPAAPPPAWIAVEPWWCGWYQNVPPMWLVGSL